MNCYRRHIGDYLKDTAHLSLLEHGVYSRLMDVYYTRELPIPADQAARLIGARSKEEREALDSVLAEFFTTTADGWHQSRCDEEIADFKEFGEETEQRRIHERERQRRHREERKALFAQLRDLGVTPAFNASTETLRSLLKERDGHVPVTRDNNVTDDQQSQPVTSQATAFPLPLPSPTPIQGSKSAPAVLAPEVGNGKRKPAKTRLPEDFTLTPELEQYASDRLPSVNIPELLASFRGKAGAKGWEYVNWRQAFQEFVRNAMPNSGHFAAGQYPKASGAGGNVVWR